MATGLVAYRSTAHSKASKSQNYLSKSIRKMPVYSMLIYVRKIWNRINAIDSCWPILLCRAQMQCEKLVPQPYVCMHAVAQDGRYCCRCCFHHPILMTFPTMNWKYLNRCCDRGCFAEIDLWPGGLTAPRAAGERSSEFTQLQIIIITIIISSFRASLIGNVYNIIAGVVCLPLGIIRQQSNNGA